ncbi:substrate-binding domain-containing protein [Bifidobacterium platyrrhinorum]|uniref:Xylose ABC transporter n=1 Tax=Bifidobacterium platyrrhinorum TaxID=2661628 RepID=A0A6L9SR26_9BIFI|nr:xylose ABC transporter [Bifidobacterium platyrrhinorum]NEG54625.1 xylose ABC transporter [Bifidobacterium platyrrhinorum]
MATRSSNIAARLIAMAAGVALLAGTAACGADGGQGQATASAASAASKADAGSAVIFTPSDGITISQRTPLNKWAKLVPAITSRLVDAGVAKKDIETRTSSDLDQQSRDVQDWVVDHMTSSGSGETAKRTTLVVAPAVESDAATRQYGDYVTQPVTAASSSSSSSSSDSASSGSSTSSSETDDAQDAGTGTAESAYSRLDAALELARESGMHVVLLANGVKDFAPDAFIRFSTAEQIGRTQAQKLVAKLDLAKASKDNPKAIEVLIPDVTDGDADDDAQDNDTFAHDAFAGMWQVLQPYFSQGKAYSPSQLLTKSSTDKDWRDVTVQADDAKGIAAELDRRLPTKRTSDGTAHTRIDGIIAMNDYVAAAVTDELDSLGYTGSAADINPQITISGIVGNIAGRKDLQRGSVPDPAKSPDNAGNAGSDDEDTPSAQVGVDESNSRWPIVTGFGGYVDTIPQVVNGKQWMTGLEDRLSLAADTARVVVRLNRGGKVADLSFVKKGRLTGVKGKVNLVEEDPLSVSASNLKSTLIDPGYITMADAGL